MEIKEVLVDRLDDNDEIFEEFASHIERIELTSSGMTNKYIKGLMPLIEKIERKLQDLSEKIDLSTAQNKSIYNITIVLTKNHLKYWLPLLDSKYFNPTIAKYFNKELQSILKYIELENIRSKYLGEIKGDFKTIFIITQALLKIQNQEFFRLNPNFRGVMEEDNRSSYLSEYINCLDNKNVTEIEPINPVKYYQEQILGKDVSKEPKSTLKNNIELEDGENILYTSSMKLWIDTDDAVEANKFMHNVSSFLSTIENVEILITDAGKGSFWQEWILKFKGFFAKEETEQVLRKVAKAAENHALDRHIEPIEKSKIERKKIEYGLDRMSSVAQAQRLNDIILSKAEEELKLLKLEVLNKALETRRKISEMLTDGLIATDSDFSIEINNLMFVDKEDSFITANTESNYLEASNKEIIDSDQDDPISEIDPASEIK